VSASSYADENLPIYSCDGDTDTLWSAEGHHWLDFEFDREYEVTGVESWLNPSGNRIAEFDIWISGDGAEYAKVFEGKGLSPNPNDWESFAFDSPVSTKYLRYYAHGSNINMFHGIREIRFPVLGSTEPPGGEAATSQELEQLASLAGLAGGLYAEPFTEETAGLLLQAAEAAAGLAEPISGVAPSKTDAAAAGRAITEALRGLRVKPEYSNRKYYEELANEIARAEELAALARERATPQDAAFLDRLAAPLNGAWAALSEGAVFAPQGAAQLPLYAGSPLAGLHAESQPLGLYVELAPETDVGADEADATAAARPGADEADAVVEAGAGTPAEADAEAAAEAVAGADAPAEAAAVAGNAAQGAPGEDAAAPAGAPAAGGIPAGENGSEAEAAAEPPAYDPSAYDPSAYDPPAYDPLAISYTDAEIAAERNMIVACILALRGVLDNYGQAGADPDSLPEFLAGVHGLSGDMVLVRQRPGDPEIAFALKSASGIEGAAHIHLRLSFREGDFAFNVDSQSGAKSLPAGALSLPAELAGKASVESYEKKGDPLFAGYVTFEVNIMPNGTGEPLDIAADGALLNAALKLKDPGTGGDKAVSLILSNIEAATYVYPDGGGAAIISDVNASIYPFVATTAVYYSDLYDVNLDGRVTLADVATVRRYLGMSRNIDGTWTPEEAGRCDFGGSSGEDLSEEPDGTIDAVDLTMAIAAYEATLL
jgi:hypothetical protein